MNLSELTQKLSRKHKKEQGKLDQLSKTYEGIDGSALSTEITKSRFIAKVYETSRAKHILIPKTIALNESILKNDLVVIDIRKATEKDLL